MFEQRSGLRLHKYYVHLLKILPLEISFRNQRDETRDFPKLICYFITSVTTVLILFNF